MTWSNAGHPPPVLLCPDDHDQLLHPGSTLFLYTDGLVECRGCDVDERIEQLRLLLAGLRGRSPAEMVDTAVEVLAPRPGTRWSRSRST